jgi:hypothetical protein
LYNIFYDLCIVFVEVSSICNNKKICGLANEYLKMAYLKFCHNSNELDFLKVVEEVKNVVAEIGKLIKNLTV